MEFSSLLPFVATILSVLMALISVLRKKRSLATWLFFAGLVLLSIDSLLAAVTLGVADSYELPHGLTLGLIIKSLVPFPWLGFSLTYSRRNYRDSLTRWSIP